MKIITALSQKLFIQGETLLMNAVQEVKAVHTEEESANGTSEEGMLTYIGVALVIIIGAILIAYGKDIFTSIMEMFKTGTSKVPTGWQ